ncbi:hypothetical protein [Flavobacterium sp.]|jgi:hypothetical protein|uniref:hypothetical protein n=1 Tax=Flavobacterium sp. TaxID=239 RepID=UPI0037BFADAF
MHISAETIDYQYKDLFPSQLEGLVSEIYEQIDSKIYLSNQVLIEKSKTIGKIEKLIQDRTGLNVVFSKHLHAATPAAIIPFFGDYFKNANDAKGFIFGMNFQKLVKEIDDIQKEKKKLLKEIHDRDGIISTKLARVSGYFSSVRHFLIIDFFGLKSYELTSREITAIILHELGHAFNGLEDHNKLETTNRAILDALNEMHEKKPESVKYKFKNKVTQKEFENASMSDSAVQQDFCAELAMDYLETVKSQMMHSKYDETNFENMADSFAARFGLGKDIVTALHKLNMATGQTFQNSAAIYFLYYTIEVLLFALLFLIIPVVGVVVFTVIMAYLMKSDNGVMTYDFPLDRYNRIKNTIVSATKKINLPKDILEDLLNQYLSITAIMDQVVQLKGIYTIAGDLIFPSSRQSSYHIDLQQKIENSLNNGLFVKSAQLRII